MKLQLAPVMGIVTPTLLLLSVGCQQSTSAEEPTTESARTTQSAPATTSDGGGFIVGIRTDNVGCIPVALPLASSGGTSCQLLVMLAGPGDTSRCAEFAGLAPADSASAQAFHDLVGAGSVDQPVCVFQQHTGGACPGSNEAGWCYASEEDAGSDGGCAQNVHFTAIGWSTEQATTALSCP